jgi:hypothetical protein
VPPGGDLFLAGPHTYAPRFDRPTKPRAPRHRVRPGLPFGGAYAAPLTAAIVAPHPAPAASLDRVGYLRLQVQPATAQVYIDRVFIGSVEDVNASGVGRALDAGQHRLEIRAGGFEPVTVDVRIPADESITFRRELARAQDRPAPPAVVVRDSSPKAMYIVPRCYAGDKPPNAAQLPVGCDLADLRMFPPAAP